YFLLNNNSANPGVVNLRGSTGLERHRLLSPFSFDHLRPTLPPSFILLRPCLRLCSCDCLRLLLLLLLLGFSPQHRPSSAFDSPFWTTNAGAPVWNNDSSLTIGSRGNSSQLFFNCFICTELLGSFRWDVYKGACA
ncbi:unnamed protein product, partial [Prunus brigantina]